MRKLSRAAQRISSRKRSRVEDITEALWGSKVSPATISELNKKAYVHIEDWRNRPLQGGRYPYVYVDGIYLRRNWGGEYENVAILVAIAANEDGFREVLGAAEGMKEDKASWVSFFQWLRGRGLDGVKLIVGDKCTGMLSGIFRGHQRVGTPEYLAMMRLRKIWAEGSFSVLKREHCISRIRKRRHFCSYGRMPPCRHGPKPQEDGKCHLSLSPNLLFCWNHCGFQQNFCFCQQVQSATQKAAANAPT